MAVLAAFPSSARADAERVRRFADFAAVVVQKEDTFSSLAAKYLQDQSYGPFIAEYNKMDSPTPGDIVLIPFRTDRKGGLSFRGYQTVPVLSYHNFSSTEANKMTVPRTMFEQQMALLREKGFHVISMDRFFDFLEFKSAIPPQSVVITIDDGWRSAYEIAYPILKQYGYPATLFIYTDRIAEGARVLSWSLLREMSEDGIETQCHTKSHRSLVALKKKESFKTYFGQMERELQICRDLVKKNLHREAKYLAYPYGDTNSLVIETAKKLGYRGALTIKRGSNPFFIHNFRVHRSMIYGDFTLAQFEKTLTSFQEEPLQ